MGFVTVSLNAKWILPVQQAILAALNRVIAIKCNFFG